MAAFSPDSCFLRSCLSLPRIGVRPSRQSSCCCRSICSISTRSTTPTRFRLYVNRTIGHGAEVLTPAAVFVINIGAVWLLGVIVVYLAWWFGSGFGLISVYLMLVNAAVHIVGAVRTRGYNPGLGTAVVLFLPVGFYAFWRIQASGEAGAADHAVGLVVGVAVHALIVVYAVRRRSVLETSKLAEPSSR